VGPWSTKLQILFFLLNYQAAVMVSYKKSGFENPPKTIYWRWSRSETKSPTLSSRVLLNIGLYASARC